MQYNIFLRRKTAAILWRQKTFMEDLRSVFYIKANIEVLGLSREARVKAGCKFNSPLYFLKLRDLEPPRRAFAATQIRNKLL